VRESLAVGAVGSERIVDVCDLQDSGFQRDGISAKAVGIAAAVQFFVMVANYRENVTKRFEGRADLFAGDGMLAHDAFLFGAQGTRLEKDAVWHGNFANIVQPAGNAKIENVLVVEAETSAQEFGVAQEKIGMAVAEILFGIDAAGEGEERGAGLLIGVGFEAEKSLDALEGVPKGSRGGPNVGGAGFVPAKKVPLIGGGFNQDYGRELIERVLFEATAESEAAAFRQSVVKKNQIRLELAAITNRGIGVVRGENIAALLLKE